VTVVPELIVTVLFAFAELLPIDVTAFVVTVGAPAAVVKLAVADVRLVSLTVVRVMTNLTLYSVDAVSPVMLREMLICDVPPVVCAAPASVQVTSTFFLYCSCAEHVESVTFGV
jgi:hypothetical protein